MTKEELFAAFPFVKALHYEASKPPKPNYCAYQAWHGLPGGRGEVGFNYLIERNVPLEHQEAAKSLVRSAMSGCQHTSDDSYIHLDDNTTCKNWEDCERSHMCEPTVACEPNFPVPVAEHPELSAADISKQKVGTTVSLVRDAGNTGVGSLLERLRHAGGGPEPEMLTDEGWLSRNGKLIDDSNEPFYLVRDRETVTNLWSDLRFGERWREEHISRWYCQQAITLVDDEGRKQLLAGAKLDGPILYRTVILTFNDSKIEMALAAQKIPVAVVLPEKIGTGAQRHEQFSLDEMQFTVRGMQTIEEGGFVIPKFPKFTGSLVELAETVAPDLPFCHKFMAALTLVGAEISGRVHFENSPHIDPRFYTILIDKKGAGKGGSCMEIRNTLSGYLKELHIMLSVDSGPALVQELVVEPKTLLFADELASLFEKAKTSGTSKNTLFEEFLTLYDGHSTANTAKSNKKMDKADREMMGMKAGSNTMQVDNAHFAMLGCVQPLMFESMWRGTRGAASGLQDRFSLAQSGLTSVPEPQRPTDTEKVRQIVERIRRQIDRFAVQQQESDGEQSWEQQFQAPKKFAYPDVFVNKARGWWKERENKDKVPSRLPAIVSRFLLMLLITNDSDTVTSELLEQAFAFGDYQIAMHGLMPEDAMTNVQEYEQIIRRVLLSNPSGLSFRQLRRVVQPEKRKLLGGYKPFMDGWKSLLAAGVVSSDRRGKMEIFWLRD